MKKEIILFGIFSLAFYLRLVYWPDGITFHYDQAHDATLTAAIWQGEDLIKLNGPSAIIEGLSTGPLFYYLLSLCYFLGRGNPAYPSLLMILINCSAVFLLYNLVIAIFKSKKIAFLSSFLFAVSFEASQVARWLSNPSLAILPLILAFSGVWKMINKKKSGLFLAALGAGLATHLDLYFSYLFFLAPIYALVFRAKIKKKYWLFYSLIFLIFILPTVLQQFKNNFLGLIHAWKFLKDIFLRKQQNFIFPIIYFKNFSKIFMYNFIFIDSLAKTFGVFLIFGSSIFCIVSKKTKEKKAIIFLLIWFFATLPLHVFPLDPVTGGYINLGINISSLILFSFWFYRLKAIPLLNFFFLSLTIASNLYLIFQENKNGNILFSVQKKMILGDQLKVIDYTYKSSNNEKFSINTLTLPLDINLVWEYHYWWYGSKRYKNLPIFTGSQQYGWHKLVWSPKKEKLHYTISEPQRGIASYFVDYFFGKEAEDTKIIEEKKFGNFLVQKRITIQ